MLVKFAVIAPAYWPTEEAARTRCWLYLASCKKFGIEPLLYGIGTQQYPGNATMRVYGQLEYLRSISHQYTHVLFSDAWDVMFTQPLQEIISRYEFLDSPPFLMGGSGQSNDFLDLHPPESYEYMQLNCFKTSGFYRFPSTTFWMGDIGYIRGQLSTVIEGAHNESLVIADAFKNGLLTPMIDTRCLIFQEKALFLEIKGGQLYNRGCNTYPCVSHFSHGHTDPVTGKDHLMLPWAKKLGIV